MSVAVPARPAPAGPADEGLVPSIERILAIEVLESQALRARALAVIFGAATLFLSFVAFLFYGQYGWSEAVKPLTSLTIVAAVASYEAAMLHMIRHRMRRGSPIPIWRWYANAGVEITAMSILILLLQGTLSNPISALATPPLLAYFLFIILSTLYLDARLSLFTGGLAAAQYLGIALFTFSSYTPDALLEPLFAAPGLYAGKICILLLGGAGAAFVAHELSRRQHLSLIAVDERNREQRANSLKSQFLADMSHEIRTPLNAVIGYAQLLATDPDITAEQKRAIEAIRVGGRHLLAVVNDVLDLSKIEAGSENITPSRFNLMALLQELTLIFAARCAEKRLSWIFDTKLDGGDVIGDEAKLRQVLTNILGNAVKFTSSGHVALHVRNGDGDLYAFEIEDTGPGIAKDRQAAIFDPFAQDIQGRINGGTGLGLAIAHRYVSLMGGQLTVDSAPNAGARFRFAVPLPAAASQPTLSAAVEPAPVRLAPGHSILALVVDDTVENRDVLKGMLARAGVTVREAPSGLAALEMVAQEDFEVGFLDIRMPGMDGLELVRKLGGMSAHKMKLVAVSASALAHERAAYLEAGFDEFLEKPVQMAALCDCLARLLGVPFEPVLRTDNAEPGEPRPFLVPEALRQSLQDAARRHNITDLKRHVAQLETLGDASRALAARLRRLSASYDMKAVGRLLDEVGHE